MIIAFTPMQYGVSARAAHLFHTDAPISPANVPSIEPVPLVVPGGPVGPGEEVVVAVSECGCVLHSVLARLGLGPD